MEIELGRLVRAIRRFWWFPVLCAAVVAAVSVLAATVMPDSYTATTRVLIVPSEVVGPSVVRGSATVLIDMATSQPVLERVIEDLGLDATYPELASDVYAAQQSGTPFILISVTGKDPQQAAKISDAVALTMQSRANELTLTELSHRQAAFEYQASSLDGRLATVQGRIAILEDSPEPASGNIDSELRVLRQQQLELAQQKTDIDRSIRDIRSQISVFYSEISIVDPARVPSEPDGFANIVLAIVGGFVGAVIGSAVILFLAVGDRTVVNSAQVERIVGKPVLYDIGPSEFGVGLSMIQLLTSTGGREGQDNTRVIALIAPTRLPLISEYLAGNEHGIAVPASLRVANGILKDTSEFGVALFGTDAVFVTQIGVTLESDVRKAKELLSVYGMPVMGSLVVRAN